MTTALIRCIAVDPGAVSGAYAMFADGAAQFVDDLPVVDGQVDAVSLAEIVRMFEPQAAVVERVASMPKQGVASTFKFGAAVGIIHGVLGALQVPTALVTPGRWKKHYNLGSDKEAARALAIRTFPEITGLSRKKDQGRAEALLLGAFWLKVLA